MAQAAAGPTGGAWALRDRSVTTTRDTAPFVEEQQSRHSRLLLIPRDIAAGRAGLSLLLLSSLWAVVYAGFMQLIALKTRSRWRSPPTTDLMEAPRSLILNDLAWGDILPGFGVVSPLGNVMQFLNIRMIERYD